MSENNKLLDFYANWYQQNKNDKLVSFYREWLENYDIIDEYAHSYYMDECLIEIRAKSPPCTYPRINSSQSVSWTCSAGGYYCSDDAKTIAICPEGSADAIKYYPIFYILILAGFIYFLQKLNNNRRLDHKIIDEFGQKLESSSSDKDLAKYKVKLENVTYTHQKSLILSNVSGQFESGEMCAIMGPSGSGKTTLMNLIFGNLSPTEGDIFINGRTSNFKKECRDVGFVPQEDIMHLELKVIDVIKHSAKMRLPRLKNKQIIEKVNKVMADLGILHVKNEIIGNEDKRGISGGQRKRVSIAMELVAESPVLFLDEPTTGLDSTTSSDLCVNLKQIVKARGLLVIAVIHSPSKLAFNQFDKLLLLGSTGKVVYEGSKDGALPYFHFIGFTFPEGIAEADFILDIVSGKIANEYKVDFNPAALPKYWRDYLDGILHFKENRMTPEEALKAKLNYNEKNEILRKSIVSMTNLNNKKSTLNLLLIGLADYWSNLKEFKGLGKIQIGNINLTEKLNILEVFRQVCILLERNLKTIFHRLPFLSCIFQLCAGIVISYNQKSYTYVGSPPKDICFTVPWNLIYACLNSIDGVPIAGINMALGIYLMSITIGIKTFGNEIMIFKRERESGTKPSSYFIANALADIVTVSLSSAFFFVGVLTFYSFRQSYASLFLFVWMLNLNAFVLGYCTSLLFHKNYYGIFGFLVAVIFAIALSGVSPAPYEISQFGVLGNIWYLSASRWLIEAFWLLETDNYSFIEKTLAPLYGYIRENYENDLMIAFGSTLIWYLVAFILLKMKK